MNAVRHYDAIPTSVPDARADVARACRGVGLGESAYEDLLVAVSEAATNVVRHSGADTFRVETTIVGGVVTVAVDDHGVGIHFDAASGSMPAPEAFGGRGLPLMEALVDEYEIQSSPQGTRVVLRQGVRLRADS